MSAQEHYHEHNGVNAELIVDEMPWRRAFVGETPRGVKYLALERSTWLQDTDAWPSVVDDLISGRQATVVQSKVVRDETFMSMHAECTVYEL